MLLFQNAVVISCDALKFDAATFNFVVLAVSCFSPSVFVLLCHALSLLNSLLLFTFVLFLVVTSAAAQKHSQFDGRSYFSFLRFSSVALSDLHFGSFPFPATSVLLPAVAVFSCRGFAGVVVMHGCSCKIIAIQHEGCVCREQIGLSLLIYGICGF